MAECHGGFSAFQGGQAGSLISALAGVCLLVQLKVLTMAMAVAHISVYTRSERHAMQKVLQTQNIQYVGLTRQGC